MTLGHFTVELRQLEGSVLLVFQDQQNIAWDSPMNELLGSFFYLSCPNFPSPQIQENNSIHKQTVPRTRHYILSHGSTR